MYFLIKAANVSDLYMSTGIHGFKTQKFAIIRVTFEIIQTAMLEMLSVSTKFSRSISNRNSTCNS